MGFGDHFLIACVGPILTVLLTRVFLGPRSQTGSLSPSLVVPQRGGRLRRALRGLLLACVVLVAGSLQLAALNRTNREGKSLSKTLSELKRCEEETERLEDWKKVACIIFEQNKEAEIMVPKFPGGIVNGYRIPATGKYYSIRNCGEL